MLAGVAGVHDHKAKEVCNDLSITKFVSELVSLCSAFGASLASLLLVLGLDGVNKMLGGEVLLVELLDLETHVVKTLEVHRLSLCMPHFLPLTLRLVSVLRTEE